MHSFTGFLSHSYFSLFSYFIFFGTIPQNCVIHSLKWYTPSFALALAQSTSISFTASSTWVSTRVDLTVLPQLQLNQGGNGEWIYLYAIFNVTKMLSECLRILAVTPSMSIMINAVSSHASDLEALWSYKSRSFNEMNTNYAHTWKKNLGCCRDIHTHNLR